MLTTILFYLIVAHSNCRDLYLNTVLESRNLDKYLLVTKANINNNEKEIVVMNYHLWNYLKSADKKFSDPEYYKETLKKKLSNREAVSIDKDSISKMEAFYVKEDTTVTNIAARGKQYFINHYFHVSERNTYARLKHTIPDTQISQIIKVLFEWNYLLAMVEGQITIINKQFSEK